MRNITLACAALCLFVAGCGGVGIVSSDNPYVKLGQSEALMDQGRIMQARRQVEEAIAIFEQNGDKDGLAQAYKHYGYVAAYGGLDADPVIIRPGGGPPNPTPEHAALAMKHFEHAAELASEAKANDTLSNIDFALATYEILSGDKQKGCARLDASLAASHEAQRLHPDKQMQLPPGVKSFDEFIALTKNEAKCPA